MGLEGLPWPAQVGVAGLGWMLAAALLYGLITGRWIVTRREADIYIKRAETAEANVERLSGQNAELIAWAELGKATFTALRTAGAEET